MARPTIAPKTRRKRSSRGWDLIFLWVMCPIHRAVSKLSKRPLNGPKAETQIECFQAFTISLRICVKAGTCAMACAQGSQLGKHRVHVLKPSLTSVVRSPSPATPQDHLCFARRRTASQNQIHEPEITIHENCSI